jgi:plastocyanin
MVLDFRAIWNPGVMQVARAAPAMSVAAVAALLAVGCGQSAPETAAAPTVAPPPRATTAAPTTVAPAPAAPTTAPATNVSPASAPTTAAQPAGSGATAAPPAAAGIVQVAVLDNSFDPRTIQVPVGTTLRWTNRGANDHDVTSTDLKTFLSPLLGPGQTFEVTLAQAGSFGYVCSLHEGMSGTVMVR